MIDPTISEWLNLILRWVHVFAGIMWVGTTYYFTWLDARLTEEEKAVANTGTVPQIWMVHSGGFYVVEKRKVPDLLSRKLHWFRWEAGTTWLSGMALLIVVYYLGGGALVDRDVSEISVGAAIGLGVGVLVVAWFVYDLLMISPLGKNEKAFAVSRLPPACCNYLWPLTSLQRPRDLHTRGCDDGDDHGRQRVDTNPAGPEKNDCGNQSGKEA